MWRAQQGRLMAINFEIILEIYERIVTADLRVDLHLERRWHIYLKTITQSGGVYYMDFPIIGLRRQIMESVYISAAALLRWVWSKKWRESFLKKGLSASYHTLQV